MTRSRLLPLALAVLAALTAWGVQTATRSRRAPAPAGMAALLPPGALLTIESPDFAQLLADWNSSPEQRAWLASDNHSVFLNSRLFGRLADARTEFEGAATNPKGAAGQKNDQPPTFDADFLTSIAGHHSVFAWYNIGNLEFVYITHLAPGQAARIALLHSRAAFTPRRIGQQTFYMRRGAGSEQGQARTVAFAQISRPGDDLLVLSTREDLIANTLRLLVDPASALNPASLAAEPWYLDASSALPSTPETSAAPALRMILNLDRIVATPYFRSYWIQRNITQMKSYRAATADLYQEPSGFREERALLLKEAASVPLPSAAEPSLDALAALAPTTGVFRATRTEDPAAAVAAIADKLLGRIPPDQTVSTAAPDPSLTPAESGADTDLETSIDTPSSAAPAASSNSALTPVLLSAGLNAVLTYSSASQPASISPSPDALWIPIHSAVLLRGTSAWNAQALQAALEQTLRGTLTTSTLGIDFHAETVAGHTLYTLAGPQPLLFSLLSSPSLGQLCLLANDRTLLLQLLEQPVPANLPTPNSATPNLAPTPGRTVYLAGFDHTTQRGPYARLTSLIDGRTQDRTQAPDIPSATDAPPFFSANLRSLSDSFSPLAGEHIQERRESSSVRQTVLYTFQRTPAVAR